MEVNEARSGLGDGARRRQRTVLPAKARGRLSAPPEVSDSESRTVRFAREYATCPS